MRGPKPPVIELTAEERQGLEELTRRHTTAQHVALRARIILGAAAGRNNTALARDLGIGVETARLWRGRWLGLRPVPLADLSVAERLTDAPRSGAPPRLTAEQVCRLVALACAPPAQAGRPLSQWSSRELAAEAVQRGIVAQLSPRHAGRLLKRGTCSRTASATG